MGDVRVGRGFSPEIAQKLESIEESKLAELLGVEQRPKASRWARMIFREENDATLKDPDFQAAWKKMKEDMRDWREDFEFKHDEEQ
jgi:hypothetical protein